MKKTVIHQIASIQQAIVNCVNSGNREWSERHEIARDQLIKSFMPSGSGFDNGTSFNDVLSSPERLVFNVSFHHMNERGAYDGWSHHTVVVTPSLVHGFTVRVTGRDRSNIKEFIAESFISELTKEIVDRS